MAHTSGAGTVHESRHSLRVPAVLVNVREEVGLAESTKKQQKDPVQSRQKERRK